MYLCGIGYETLFHVYLHGVKWSAQKTTEACDWVIGTHISDIWRPYAFGLIDMFVCYLQKTNENVCISIFLFFHLNY